jgi:hypothetical protein
MKDEPCTVCGKICKAGEGGRGMCDEHYQADQHKQRYAAKLRARPQSAFEAMAGIAEHLLIAEVISEEEFGEQLAWWTQKQTQLLIEQSAAAQAMIDTGKRKRLAPVIDAAPAPLPAAAQERDLLLVDNKRLIETNIKLNLKGKKSRRTTVDRAGHSLIPGLVIPDKHMDVLTSGTSTKHGVSESELEKTAKKFPVKMVRKPFTTGQQKA